MKKHVFFVWILCFPFFGSAGYDENAGNDEFKTIENKLYSISIPVNWGPSEGMPNEGIEPGERDIRGFHLFYWFWHSPIRSEEDFLTTVGIDIQSYRKTDGESLSVEETEQMEMSRIISEIPVKKENIWPGKDQKRFFIIKQNKEMDGEIVRYRYYYLFQRDGNIVHCINVSLRDDHLAKQPEWNEKIKKIFDSFRVNGITIC